MLTEKEKARRIGRPYTSTEEQRYTKVKRGMGAIKFVLNERRIINLELKETQSMYPVNVNK